MKEEPQESAKEELQLTYKEKLKFASIIAKPMASKSQCKKIYKLIKQAVATDRSQIVCGLKDVQRALRKNQTGTVIFGADISPVDIVVHLPGVCEEKDIPYCFTPSRSDIGHAVGMKRPVLVVLIKQHANYQELFDECKEFMTQAPVY